MENVTKTVPVVLLIAVITKTLFSGCQLADSLVILGLSGLVYLLNSLQDSKKSKKIQEEIAVLRNDLEKYEKEIAETKQYVSGIKMATTLSGKR